LRRAGAGGGARVRLSSAPGWPTVETPVPVCYKGAFDRAVPGRFPPNSHHRRGWPRSKRQQELMDNTLERIRTGDRRLLAKAISRIENGSPDAVDLLKRAFP